MNSFLPYFPRKSRQAMLASCVLSMFLFQPALGAAAGRPIIADGTVKTADGHLLRGCHAHISKGVTAEILTFFTKLDNVIKMRDQAHLNVIRICCLSPGWGGFNTPEEAFPYVDQVVNNCETAGIYAIINYHGPMDTSGAWSITGFWSKVAARYKDKTFVMFNLVNEQVQCSEGPGGGQLSSVVLGVTPNGWSQSARWFVNLYKAVRPLAPNTLIFGIEPVNLACDWSTWLKSPYGSNAGLSWASGIDAFSFHTYLGTTGPHVLKTQAGGIPIINTEYSFREEGWPIGDLEGDQCHAEFMEKYGISHMVWQEWQGRNADQLQSVMNYLVADAVAKGYAWWTFSTPTAPTNLQNTSASVARIILTWAAPSNLGGGLMRYLVYRNGVQIGRAAGLTFTDSTVKAGTAYRYEVSTLGKGSLESPRSLPLDIAGVDAKEYLDYSARCKPAPGIMVYGNVLAVPAGRYSLRIVDASGKTVLSREGVGPDRCDLSMLPRGVFAACLDRAGSMAHERIVIGRR